MPITISLPPETEEKLRKRAAASGVAADALARDLLEQALNGDVAFSGGHAAALEDVLGPWRKEVQDSCISDDELKQFFTDVRDEVRSEKRTRPSQP